MGQEEYKSTENLVQATAQERQISHLYSALFLSTIGRVTITAVGVKRASNRKTSGLERARGDKRWHQHQSPLVSSSTKTWPRSHRRQTAGTSWGIAQDRLHEMGEYIFPNDLQRLHYWGRPSTTEKPFEGGERVDNFESLSKAMGPPEPAHWRRGSIKTWETGAELRRQLHSTELTSKTTKAKSCSRYTTTLS